MAVDRSAGADNLIFNIDTAAPVDPPPVLFYAMRAPCACGRALTDCHHTFFPSSVFIHGMCSTCGPQTAIFAPEMKGQGEKLPDAIARRLARLTQDLARAYGESTDVIVNEFLHYLAHAEAQDAHERTSAQGTVSSAA